VLSSLSTAVCPFCAFELRNASIDRDVLTSRGAAIGSSVRSVSVCDVCGWWRAIGTEVLRPNHLAKSPFSTTRAAAACLRSLDLADSAAPINDIRSYLVAKWDDRIQIDRRKWELVVGDVFASIGFKTRVTGYSKDGGIDVILDGPNGKTIGVQVRHSKNRIQVEPVRALSGALMEHGHYAGIFVTTSDFTAGARDHANVMASRGMPVSLVNADRFYQALRLAQLESASEVDNLVLGVPFAEMMHVNTGRSGRTRGGARSPRSRR
jgi:restriction system protein